MRTGFTAVIERDGAWFVAHCPGIPGANGQGRSKEEAKQSLSAAASLILEDRREDGLRGVAEDGTEDLPQARRFRNRSMMDRDDR